MLPQPFLRLAISLIFLTLFPIAPPSRAATFTVETCDEAHFVAQLNAAEDGDTINFACSGTITLSAEITLEKELIIDGTGQNVTISGGGAVRIFQVFSPSLELRSLAFADGYGGPGGAIGFISPNGILLITDCLFLNNVSDTGGAIYDMRGLITVERTTFSGNRAIGPSAPGGAIRVMGGGLRVRNSIFINNRAANGGGSGGAISNAATVEIRNSTFSNNSTSDSGYGGAIFNRGGVSIYSSTFVDNTSGTSSTIHNLERGTASIFNSIIVGGSCGGIDSSNDDNNNIVFNAEGCPGANVDPLLEPLADNGGATLTFALRPDSPAIDAYTMYCSETDQRGVPRPQGAACDIGAFEAESPLVVDTIDEPSIILEIPPLLMCDENDTQILATGLSCVVLMRDNVWVGAPGSVPASLVALGVQIAVEISYYEASGHIVSSFPAYQRICLEGEGRIFYLDGRDTPRIIQEMITEGGIGYTCVWIAAPGTVGLTR